MDDRAGIEARLTERQREILALIARGKTNGQIADELGIGFETVKMHVSRILAELDVTTREEAAELWHRSRKLTTRLKAIAGLSLGLKAAGGAVGVAAAGGVILVGAATMQSLGNSNGGAFAAYLTATPTVQEEPVATPTPVPETAPAVQLVSFYADALLTEVHVEFDLQSSGHLVFFLTEPGGTTTRLHSEDSTISSYRLVGPPVSPQAGDMVLVAYPEESVGSPGTPPPGAPLATFTIPFDGHAGTVASVTPAVREVAMGDVVVVLDEVLASERRTEVRFHLEGPGAGALTLVDPWGSLALASGGPVMTHEALLRSNEVDGTWGHVQFGPASGDVVLTMRFEVQQVPAIDGRVPTTGEDTLVAEFHFTLP